MEDHEYGSIIAGRRNRHAVFRKSGIRPFLVFIRRTALQTQNPTSNLILGQSSITDCHSDFTGLSPFLALLLGGLQRRKMAL
jgi:hypothetical protein